LTGRKYMPFSSGDVKRILLRKFQFQETQGTKHDAFSFFYNGKKVATTRFSRGANVQISDALLSQMAKEIRVGNLRFFREMISCTNSYEAFVHKLKEGGYIETD
jgi:hypothetical protein